MARIHDVKEPELKTLFRFMTPKPRDPLYNSPQSGFNLSEKMGIAILFHSIDIAAAFTDQLPPYVVRIFYNKHKGYMKLDSAPDHMQMNPEFDGITAEIELSPLYDRAEMLRSLYVELKAIGEAWAEANNVLVNWNEDYAYIGAHYDNLKYIGPTLK